MLAERPRTARELAVALGYDADDPDGKRHVRTTVSRLRSRGEPIQNTRRPGSHGGALYSLGRRHCGHPGCITILSDGNPGQFCRRHVFLHTSVVDLLIGALTMDVGGEVAASAEAVGQLSLLPATAGGAMVSV